MQQTIGELTTFMERFTKALNALVEGVALIARDEVAEFLSQYNELVPEYDQRLQQCATLLSKGLRDEALGYESDDPSLLETVTQLDLSSRPQWPRWLDALRALGFPEPAMPKVEIAVELREAQERVAALKPLLDQWRRCNLAHTPLAMRIATLRRLRKEDPNNEAWYDCLRVHEKQRAMEIEADVKGAFAAKDEQRLVCLDEEFKADWLEPPSPRIRTTVENALQAVRDSRIDRDVEQIAAGLAAAFDAKDVDAGRALRDRWNHLVAEKNAFMGDDPHMMRAVPAVEWVERHDRLESLFVEVWQSLDARPATRQSRREWVRSLSRMRDEVEDLTEKLRDEIDLEPVERLRGRVARVEDEHQREQTGRRRLMYLSIGAVTAVIVGSVATVVSLVRHTDRVRQAVAEIDGLLRRVEKGEVAPDELPALDLPEWLAEDPAVSAKAGLLDAAAKGEQQRRKRLGESLDKLTEMLDDLAKTPRGPSLEPWPEPFVSATKVLAEITGAGVAKTDDEKAALAKADGRLQNAARRLQRDADEALAARITEMATRLARIRDQMANPQRNAVEELAGIAKEAETLRGLAAAPAAPGAATPFADFQRASRSAARPLNADEDIGKAIAAIKDGMDERERFQAAEQGITEALGDWSRYAERLEAAAAEFPKQATARDYGEAAKDVAQWQAVEAWNAFAATVKSFAELDPARARAVADGFTKAKDAGGQLAFLREFADRHEPYVKAFGERDLGAIGRDLAVWTEREWLGELEWSVTTAADTDERRTYYCLQKPRQGSLSFKYQRDMKVAGAWPDAKSEAMVENSVVSVSPQKALAVELEKKCVAKIPANANGIALDENLVEAIACTLAAKGVDPCLRVVTLRKLLLVGRAVSPLFQAADVSNLFGQLDDGNGSIPDVQAEELGEFLDPNRLENRAYLKVRKIAERALAQAGPVVAGLQRAVAETRRRLESPNAAALTCVGRLGRDIDGAVAFVPSPSSSVPPGGELLVIGPGGSVATVGKCGPDGRATIAARGSLVAGVPVFAWQQKGTK